MIISSRSVFFIAQKTGRYSFRKNRKLSNTLPPIRVSRKKQKLKTLMIEHNWNSFSQFFFATAKIQASYRRNIPSVSRAFCPNTKSESKSDFPISEVAFSNFFHSWHLLFGRLSREINFIKNLAFSSPGHQAPRPPSTAHKPLWIIISLW